MDLAQKHLRIVQGIVRQVSVHVPAHVDRGDLLSAGYLGLVEAARSYDPARGAPFGAYARHRVRGAVLDELRSGDWLPRELRRQVRALEDARGRLTAGLGRAPTVHELGSALGLSVAAVRNLESDAAHATVGSLDELTDPDRLTGEPFDTATVRAEKVAAALDDLPAHLRAVIDAAFYSPGLTHQQAGAAIGVRPEDFYHLRNEAVRVLRVRLGVPPPAVRPGTRPVALPRRLAHLAG